MVAGDFHQTLPIRITLKDGRVFEHTTASNMILGAQQNPWGFENIKGKFRANAGLALTEEGVDAAVVAWSDIPQMTDIAGAVRKTLVK
jgi:hypothetical protein